MFRTISSLLLLLIAITAVSCECTTDPCEGWSCFGKPGYFCVPDYVNCSRTWETTARDAVACDYEVEHHACATVRCALPDCENPFWDGEGCCPVCCDDPVECLVDPCENWECKGQPGWTCKPNYCGGCNRQWINSYGGTEYCRDEVYEEDPCAAIMCPAVVCDCVSPHNDGCCDSCCTEPCVECLVDPCDGMICNDDATLVCEANYCGGCNRLWRGANGKVVPCFDEGRDVDTVGPRVSIPEPITPELPAFSSFVSSLYSTCEEFVSSLTSVVSSSSSSHSETGHHSKRSHHKW